MSAKICRKIDEVHLLYFCILYQVCFAPDIFLFWRKIMKKTRIALFIVLVVILTVMLCACGENGSANQSGKADNDTNSECLHHSISQSTEQSYCTIPTKRGETICTDCGKVLEEGYYEPAKGHVFVNDQCVNCGFIEGLLKFSLTDDETGYVCDGFEQSAAEDVTIPTNYDGKLVVAIGKDAFMDCKELKNVFIPHTVKELRTRAFYRSGLTEITIPGNVKKIGYKAFLECLSLESVYMYEGVEELAGLNFSGCSKLKSINFPDSLTIIKHNPFSETAWYDNQPDGLVYAGKVAYKYKGQISKNSKIAFEKDTKAIAGMAFYNQENLTSIEIPDTVLYIGPSAFSNCVNLENVRLSDNLERIDDFAFYKCEKLTSVVLPKSVKTINYEAFYDCTALENVVFPENLEYIGESAFYGTKWFNDFYDKMPNGFCYIGKVLYFYKGVVDDTEIKVKDGTVGIAGGAFLQGDCSKVNSIVLPDTLKYLGRKLFLGYPELRTITIPKSVIYIGEMAFYKTLEEIHYKGTRKEWCAISKDQLWYFSGGLIENIKVCPIYCEDDINE